MVIALMLPRARHSTCARQMPSVGLLDPSPMMSQLPGSEHSACSAARISGVWGFRGAWTIDGSEIRRAPRRTVLSVVMKLADDRGWGCSSIQKTITQARNLRLHEMAFGGYGQRGVRSDACCDASAGGPRYYYYYYYYYYLLLRSTCRAIEPGAPVSTSRLVETMHPLATEWRRLEELFRPDSIVSTLIVLMHPRTLDVVERVISDVLRELVKALRD
ncbi:uncharacterized protein SCHCODRAFT_02603837 [Schizophyllum commune H4-8]|uniref:uncharacterized protein n=1 Tax=Schizophyllum commune (strain H4-8 / FGSC 9210) TaxID=578458 RepID=UPI002160E2F8|nr:uncharacterized protein SCHCODRAFT_02603837 [Schizophyllum commune H4-8]KAI5836662.1 hypothetical protein SCHCODRAFT_02603837 [Schizophyllum commune H4-8]